MTSPNSNEQRDSSALWLINPQPCVVGEPATVTSIGTTGAGMITLALHRRQMEGWGWQSVHDPKVLPKVLERWKTSIATGEPFDIDYHYVDPTGYSVLS